MATWEDRLKDALGPGGYTTSMRRSLQTVILFEANRCVSDAFSMLRPFQKKFAYMDMANALLESLTCVPEAQKEEILYRTGTSKEVMQPEIAWKRRKLLMKELEKIVEAMGPLEKGRTHNDAVNMYVQQQYVSIHRKTKTRVTAPFGYVLLLILYRGSVSLSLSHTRTFGLFRHRCRH